MDWRLANVEERAQAAPDTFAIPPLAEREALRPGDLAKLVFLDDEPGRGPGGERMWVEIDDVTIRMDIAYGGVLRNSPVVVAGLSFGDRVRFGPEHIADFERVGPTPIKS